MNKFNITDKELVEALEINLTRLYEICDEFDADPDDEWALDKGTHFEPGPLDSKIFSPEGAVEICNYLEENKGERPLLIRWKRWLLQRDRRLKGLMVSKRVTESASIAGQLVFKGDRAFLGSRGCREVLGLGKRQDVLNKAFVQVQRSVDVDIEPMAIDVDFFEDESQGRFFSRSGLASVGQCLGTSLKSKHRRDWANVVVEYAPKALEAMEKIESEKEKRIKRVMEVVRRNAKKTCQLTGRKCNSSKIKIAVHHLYNRQTYPHLADVESNLMAIGADIHDHFHMWMGGTDKSCTIEDLERYVQEFHSSLFAGDSALVASTLLKLSHAKKHITPFV